MDKVNLKIEKEIELIGYLLNNPNLKDELFAKISVEKISKEFQGIFVEISQTKNLDKIALIHILKKNNFAKLSEALQAGYAGEGLLERRIQEFYEISDSITTEHILNELLTESKESFKGLALLTEAKERIEDELEKYNRFESEITFAESLEGILERMNNRFDKSDSIKTNHFYAMDKATTGFNPGNLVGIAGAYKNGKTTFGLNAILNIASQNIPTAIFSLEMSLAEIEDKILAYKSNVKYESIRNPKLLTPEDKKALSSVKNKSNEKLFIFDKVFTMNEIEAKIKNLVKRHGVKVILIDYLGLIKSVSKYKNAESREREMSQISNSLKIIAKETETIIFVLAQLNRSGIKDATSGNLAESLGLARDSDIVFTIRRIGEDVKLMSELKTININGKSYPATSIDANDFLVKLDSSRHSKAGCSFLIRLNEAGRFTELNMD